MSKKQAIPVNQFGAEDMVIERVEFDKLPELGEWQQPERHDRHSFFLLEKGSVTMEIDFQVYEIRAPSVIYMHPDQVHKIRSFKHVSVVAWAIHNEHLTKQNLAALEVTAPISLHPESYALIADTAAIAMRFKDRQTILNALIELVIALFDHSPAQHRSYTIAKSFKQLLEQRYVSLKRPNDYAQLLHLSVPYLNECIKNATGHSVSHQIQQRIILEAKRLLYHSAYSLKEIAMLLGYDDYAYFSRLFTNIVGTSPATFRKNHD
ncbi:helix-turn-helix domain-containing protein [Taibaiella soli]|uniref:AraC family transcriptional regulator n=1 Tax=Taibaiella soli TaxID=1649169 RepID=A0A2W2B3Y5_9BACT|nr:helix-turn-helix transcriptional regulator [Taibaiella soli]PZF70837.1 AraC family transcriptional regulator [Taibaiella soli]